ncbi:non-hydrolyzing UDP-N-acetylglucosamine 2-epimerase [Brachybacterium phenoliresistens]|uniref:non-hydrolyzing UDP-N-acetylglucosamine 2-epimerase n=1 Tax=Brachybacterium phenoliresistens TaxID=396014 RepID=UPI0031DDF6C9
MTIYGTRPESIKVAPVIRAIDDAEDMENIVVITGQHREMVDQVNELFGIVPDHDLDIMREGQTLNQIAARVIAGVDAILEAEQPDLVIVQGDTTTVAGAAFAAFNRRVRVVHLEAGLRSGNNDSPFPEEANRRIATQVATLHLAPTASSKANLIAEGIAEDTIVVTGNSVIDTLLHVASLEGIAFEDRRLQALRERKECSDSRVLLVTTHRRENLGGAMTSIGRAIADIAVAYPELTIVLPLHPNPEIRGAIEPHISGLRNVFLLDALPYAQFNLLLALADIVLTDSGGVQEEAPSLGKPVLVMRDNTERPEAVEAGTVKLVGTDRATIVAEVSRLLDTACAYESMANAVNPYGDGFASERTVAAIRWMFRAGARPRDFSQ